MRRRRDGLGRFVRKIVPRRDEMGRFVEKYVPRRDDLGRFAEVPVRKVPSRKISAKKAPVKKVSPRKIPPRKVLPHKAPPRKAPPREAPFREVPPRKVPPRKVLPRKATLRKAPPHKAPLRKAPPRKAPPRKVPPRKAPPRKVPPRKAPPRKAPPHKAPPRKAPPRKVPPRKAPPRKAPPRKAPLRKAPPRKAPPRKVPARKKARRRRRGSLPPVPERSREADALILGRLAGLMEIVGPLLEGADVGCKSHINADGSVDGELKISDLPDELREEENLPQLVAILSEVFRAFRPFPASPPMGGRFWVSFALRFGPQDETEVGKLAELYKRFRGLFQVGTYPAAAWHPTPIQLALTTGLKTIVEGVARRQGFPPSVILIRFTWTPDGKRPGHFAGEAGGGR